MIVPRAGTIAIKDTPLAKLLIKNWAEAAERVAYGHTDESALAQALEQTPGLRIVQLTGPLNEFIKHDYASRDLPKVTHIKRALRWAFARARA